MLDNPIWHALRTRHSGLAISAEIARRYPPEVAPFVGVSEATPEAATAVLEITGQGEAVGILGVIPPLGSEWRIEKEIEIHQYVWPADLPAASQPEAEALGEDDIPGMMSLTALVYPSYFRPETARLGAYYGVRRGGELCAMAGIRMAMDGYQELSAICTHPEHRGRGYAALLTRHLVHRVQTDGEVAFLHTESDNEAAKALYEKLGFVLRKELPFRVIGRPAS